MIFLKKSRMTERPIYHVTILINITVLSPLCMFLEYIQFVVSLLGQL